jgi:hypothetical protein
VEEPEGRSNITVIEGRTGYKSNFTISKDTDVWKFLNYVSLPDERFEWD